MKQYRNLIKPYLVWAFVVIVIPLILIALYAFTEDGNEVLTFSFTLENFRKFLEATYMSVIFKSFKLGNNICQRIAKSQTDDRRQNSKLKGLENNAHILSLEF